MAETKARMLYPISEAQHLLGVGHSKLYELAKRGEIRLVKCDNKSLITAKSIGDYVARLASDD